MVNIKWNKDIFVIVAVFISIFFTTIVYAAFNTQLSIKGEAIVRADQEIRITDFRLIEVTNDASEEFNSKYEKNTTSLFVTMPSSSSMTYEITITNKNTVLLYGIKNRLTLNNTNSKVKVEYGINVGDCIEANSSKKFTITLKNDTLSKQSLTLINQFEFEVANWNSLETNFMSENKTGDLSVNSDGVTFEFSVTNPNTVNVDYKIAPDNGRFTINDTAIENTTFEIAPNETKTHQVKIKLRKDVTYENLTEIIKIMLRTISPINSNIKVESISLKLPQNFKSNIISSMPIETTPANFAAIESENGYLYRVTDLNDSSYTYYYRGVIENNYVSFAGQLWRIVRIDHNGNVRLVLNDNVSEATQYTTKYVSGSVNDIESAIPLVDYKNSNVREQVEKWYTQNIASKTESKYVMNSDFCVNNNYKDPITSADGNTINYFPAYQHVGIDLHNYSPDFSCSSESIFTNKVGLLQAEDVLAAGGHWGTDNQKYYLFNPDKAADSQTSWTLSSSYYSVNEKQAGVIVYNQAEKGLFDWIMGGNLGQYYGYRPVISLNGNVQVSGNGTKDTPYRIIENAE